MCTKHTAAIVALFTLFAPAGMASETSHGDGHGGGHTDIGAPGAAAKASQTITVTLYDNYFEPEMVEVAAGETVRFKIVNAGELVHEFNIGTAEMHEEHAPMMQMMVDHGVIEADRINHQAAKDMQHSVGHGEHDEPNSVLLEPGQSNEIVWTFPKGGSLEFACNVPGHYDGGMVGEFEIHGGHSALN